MLPWRFYGKWIHVPSAVRKESVHPDEWYEKSRLKSRCTLRCQHTKAARSYSDVEFEDDCYIMFGKESAGIPENILKDYQDTSIRIPMWGEIRSLNLSNSVAIVLYEALRQNNFTGMEMEGHLRGYDWS